jgi:hypothetical protein
MKGMTRQEWSDHAMNTGTSGDMVMDILRDWKKDEAKLARAEKVIVTVRSKHPSVWYDDEGNSIDCVCEICVDLKDFDQEVVTKELNHSDTCIVHVDGTQCNCGYREAVRKLL